MIGFLLRLRGVVTRDQTLWIGGVQECYRGILHAGLPHMWVIVHVAKNNVHFLKRSWIIGRRVISRIINLSDGP
ncbi:hypothetical protein HF669_14755 [Acidithiobacillus thiooxidans]|jgi:hypothetical protein|uniref:Uncharacterized protein n=2 Tax=Acidithiobacillus TaxID=119977 RepID=A0A1C2INC6_ACITH|nr:MULTISPECIES: hypothetical protein [Acidithiobacillus]MBU2758618.1 hypothetical protein [Acidithiobacillus sulfurivorans]MBU2812578.1 hypothetical protein [Acidithiobacillus thiooxidans]OCX69606.1 hypothetical protein A6P07_16150 [Acidithiobacillus thiooxidans]OCX73805.1 hypothetical protein A6M23_07625 [Acidithiobacillus thiooxidans]OCX77533.1 hypothetical protein A6O24_06530 [Acidithiobacillus thiooxidans]